MVIDPDLGGYEDKFGEISNFECKFISVDPAFGKFRFIMHLCTSCNHSYMTESLLDDFHGWL